MISRLHADPGCTLGISWQWSRIPGRQVGVMKYRSGNARATSRGGFAFQFLDRIPSFPLSGPICILYPFSTCSPAFVSRAACRNFPGGEVRAVYFLPGVTIRDRETPFAFRRRRNISHAPGDLFLRVLSGRALIIREEFRVGNWVI